MYEIAGQINGKTYMTATIENMNDSELTNVVLSSQSIQDVIKGKTIRKIVVVPNKLVNIIVT